MSKSGKEERCLEDVLFLPFLSIIPIFSENGHIKRLTGVFSRKIPGPRLLKRGVFGRSALGVRKLDDVDLSGGNDPP